MPEPNRNALVVELAILVPCDDAGAAAAAQARDLVERITQLEEIGHPDRVVIREIRFSRTPAEAIRQYLAS